MVSPNIFVNAVYNFLNGIGTSIHDDLLLTPFLISLGYSVVWVGYLEGISGLLGTLIAMPVGYLADKYHIDVAFLRAGALVQILALGTLISGILMYAHGVMTQNIIFWLGFVAIGVIGIGGGLSTAPILTVFSNSIPTGSRTDYFIYSRIARLVGEVVGPLVGIAILIIHGNQWTFESLQTPFVAAMAITISSFALVSFSSSSYMPQSGTEHVAADEFKPRAVKIFLWFRSDKHIPMLIVLQDIVFGLASGMTVKFFGLFFEEIVQLDPVSMQILSIAIQTNMIIWSYVVKLTSKWIGTIFILRFSLVGRIETCLVMLNLGLLCLFLFAFGQRFYWHNKVLMCLIHVLRVAFMNVTDAITESILNDYTPQEERNFFNSFASIASFGWSGSAMIGGWILSSLGYEWCFTITFFVQYLAVLPYWILLFLVEKEEQPNSIDVPDVTEKVGLINNSACDTTSDDDFTQRIARYDSISSLS